MDIEKCIAMLSNNKIRIQTLLQGVTQEEARYKPHPDSWSMLEVINHLFDEEKEDFRHRLKGVLHDPTRDLPPINPEAWIMDRSYNTREFLDSIHNFLDERDKSLQWLKSLSSPDWDQTYQRGDFTIRAGDIFASWIAHDQLHMRQLIELQREILLMAAGSYQVDYAGLWEQED
mgnify:CR=1 FL=1